MSMKRKTLLFLLLALPLAAGALGLTRSGQLDDAAGTPGKRGFSGDGGDALSARLNAPMGIAADQRGNIYFSDTANHRVRRVSVRTGEIETVAGTGEKGFENDGGHATMAALNSPTGLAFDSLGNLFIADTGNQRIRMYTPNGYLYTVAGNGRKGYNGDGMRPASAQLNNPTGVAVSPRGELYISDTGNHLVRKIDRQSGFLVNVAGNGDKGNDGDLGLAVNAKLNKPSAIIFDKRGNLFIADTGNHQVRWVEPVKTLIFTIAGTGRRGFSGEGDRRCKDSMLNNPTGLAIDQTGRLYISDTDNHRVRRLVVDRNFDSKIETVAGTGEKGYNGDGKDAWNVKLSYPGAVVITRHDFMYFVDAGNSLIRRVQGVSAVEPPVLSARNAGEVPADKKGFAQELFGPTAGAEK